GLSHCASNCVKSTSNIEP
nr:hypothetical protein [Tanacetum cinerariifolium]